MQSFIHSNDLVEYELLLTKLEVLNSVNYKNQHYYRLYELCPFRGTNQRNSTAVHFVLSYNCRRFVCTFPGLNVPRC